MDFDRASAFTKNMWDGDVVPALTDYIRIPNKSPAFDPDWESHGYMDRAVKMFSAWAKQKLAQLPGSSLAASRASRPITAVRNSLRPEEGTPSSPSTTSRLGTIARAGAWK
mgnify:CR=1 FL=1